MKIGTQIIAAEGWGPIPKEVVLHFLCSDAKQNRVLLVHFTTDDKGRSPRASLIVVSRKEFEDGTLSKAIVPTEQQAFLPPWLKELEGIDLSQVDALRSSSAQIPHFKRVEDRYLIVALAVRDFNIILAAKDPVSEINRRARQCVPTQNESRFRLWLLTYLCFGRNVWSLLPPFHHAGHWDRLRFPETKFGAPSKAHGKRFGCGISKEVADQCVKSYLKRAKLGKHMTDIHDEAMIEDFRCQVVSDKFGLNVYAYPDGKAAPTYWQFVYRVYKAIGRDTVQQSLYGAVRHRTNIATSKGRFSEEVANLMERVEVDAYYVKERPKGYVEGSTLPALCVVVGRDLLSGKKVGIGFSFGSEKSTAYRMMLFSMAVPKEYFCRLFGVPLNPGEWTSEGLPGHFAIDRGPGAKRDLVSQIEKRFPIRDMAPSWSGQSKATIESSHPNDVRLEGQPTFVKSNLTPIEMAKREVLRLINFNSTANMEERFDPDSELAYVPPSPNGLWQHFDALYRNDAQPMSLEDAIRTFLTPIEFLVKEDGVYLRGRRFCCDDLRDSGLLDLAAGHGHKTTRVSGYMLDMCVRYIWIEYQGRLIEVSAMLRIRGDEDSLFMSLEELDQWDKARKIMGSAFRVHQRAASSEIKQRFKDEAGQNFSSGKRKAGRPTRSAQTRQEIRDVLHSGNSRKVA